jgi:hypothetical protein
MGHRLHIAQVRRTGVAPDESRFLKSFFFQEKELGFASEGGSTSSSVQAVVVNR